MTNMADVNILLVDDDLKNSMLLKKFLEVEGYNVTYANNGAVGWELFSSTHPDLVLLDVNMPELNGFELARKIREADQEVIIFFLTDRTEINDRLKGFSLKGNDYIPKPFYPEELIEKIKERFRHKAAEAQTKFVIGNTIFDSNLSTVTIHHKQPRSLSPEETRAMTARQTEILLMLVRNLGRMVNRGDILRTIWGDDSNANSLALNVQITYLRRLLEGDPAISIQSIKKKGYVLKVSETE